MIALFRSEFLKLRTTRTVLVLTLALAGLVGLGAGIALGVADGSELGDVIWQADLVSAAASALGFAFFFGILVLTGEFRHGTATPTFLVSPRREQVVLAKVLAAALGGALLVVLAVAVIYLLSLVLLPARGAEIHLFESIPLGRVLALAGAGAFCGALGVGLGAIVRSQIGAVLVALGWFLVLEPLIGTVSPRVATYLPAAGLLAIVAGNDDLSRIGGIAVSAGYAAALCVVGAALVVRRDVA